MSDETFSFNSRLDGEFLLSIYEDDKEHAEMVFETFVKTIGGQMEEIESSYVTGDPEAFRKKMHKIKPVLSFVGLTGLTKKAEQIEKSCAQVSDINVLSDLYTGFKSELNEMIPVVQEDLIKLSA